MSEQIICLNGADMTDPGDPEGRSYRQVNAARTHAIPIGALVELESGERLRVMKHTRDCDQTPLYSLGLAGSGEDKWARGYPEYCLMDLTEQPYEDTLSIEQLRATVREDSDRRCAVWKAFWDLPEMASEQALWALAMPASKIKPDLWPVGKAEQLRLGLDAVPPTTELECAAGLWAVIRDVLRARAAK